MRITLEPNVLSGEDVLTIEGLSKSFGDNNLFSGIDMDIKRGEHVALIGGNGTGKTTILKMINRLVSKDAGAIILGSRVKIGYYDQEHQVLTMSNTIFDEISDAYPDLSNTRIRNVLAAFLFTGEDVFKRIQDLSGGERGRVSLAKLMLSSANFLILDEPTRGIDVGAKYDIYCLINQMVEQGKSVIMISSEMPEILGMCDRVYIMNEGKMAGELDAKEATQEGIMAHIMQNQKK